MAVRCDMCGKGPVFGHNVSHSKHRTKRIWRPNVQPIIVQEGNTTKRLNVCTRCLRTLHKTE